ncbi:MAG: PspC domain-containing protein [Planctomycetota bacterium]|jgi:phage shock protein PspC (stress-responsive transcriptional regulator)
MNTNNEKKLTKSLDDYVLRGVLGGIAEFYGWSSTTLRFVFVFLSISTAAFPGLLIYIALAILMPEPEDPKKFNLEDYRVQ